MWNLHQMIHPQCNAVLEKRPDEHNKQEALHAENKTSIKKIKNSNNNYWENKTMRSKEKSSNL